MVDVKRSRPGSDRRRYRSSLRSAQAAGTRAAVLAAAHELFVAQGYGATTIDQIAARAGVSKPTVFASVGNKQAVLAAVRDVAIAGDDEPVAVSDRPAVAKVVAEPDPRRAVRLLATHIADVGGRYASIHDVLRGAAATGEPALRQLWELSEQQRLEGARHHVSVLAAKGPLVCDDDRAADILWLLMDPENYRRLVQQRGWSREAFEKWVSDSIVGALLGGAG